MKIRLLLSAVIITMSVSIPLAMLWVPTAEILGEASRILYFHVPVAWVSVLAFITAGIFSLVHLLDRNNRYPLSARKAYNAAYIGLFFTMITVISGSLWAKISWGSYWNWDPRERSIVLLLLVYIAYFILHASVGSNRGAARIGSAYLIVAMAAMPFLVFVIPRVYPSLHPETVINTQGQIQLESSMRIALLASTISFTLLFAYLLQFMNRITGLEFKIEGYYETR